MAGTEPPSSIREPREAYQRLKGFLDRFTEPIPDEPMSLSPGGSLPHLAGL